MWKQLKHFFALDRCGKHTKRQHLRGGGKKKKAKKTVRRRQKSVSMATTPLCFPGAAVITMETGKQTTIANIRVGDRVMAADSKGIPTAATVVFVPHEPNFEWHSFCCLTTATKKLHMTNLHYIPVIRLHPVTCQEYTVVIRCQDVEIGDRLFVDGGADEAVVAIEKDVQCIGVYSFVTDQEFLMVDGVIASPFGHDLFSHETYHKMFQLLRYMYRYAPEWNKQPSVANFILGTEKHITGWLEWFGLRE
jgi:hypothetical protein